MNIFKAFAQIGPLTNNTAGVIAPVGELAPMSLTFVRKQPTQHTHADFNNLTLVGFSYKVDDTDTQVTDGIAYECLKAINWTYNQARLGQFTEQKDSFQQKFITQWGDTFDLIDSGSMTAFDVYWCPSYINIAPKDQSATIDWRIWFANEAFYNQFDEYTILVVPPITELDQFFNDSNTVKDIIDGITTQDIVNRVDIAKGIYPYTVLRTDTFDWFEENGDNDIRYPTPWTTVIYGLAGDNVDARKEAIRDYILDNSTHTRDEWAVIFPDLFTSTEIILTPMWNHFAIPNATRELGLFSPTVNFVEAMELAHLTCKGVKYTNTHIDGVIESIPTLYRSLSCLAVGGPENRDGVDRFYEKYPDYLNVPTTHVDFMRMKEETRKFVLLLTNMLEEAEVLTPNSGIPQGFNRLTREGVLYLATTYGNFLWLVVSKYSVDQLTA